MMIGSASGRLNSKQNKTKKRKIQKTKIGPEKKNELNDRPVLVYGVCVGGLYFQG